MTPELRSACCDAPVTTNGGAGRYWICTHCRYPAGLPPRRKRVPREPLEPAFSVMTLALVVVAMVILTFFIAVLTAL